MGKWATRQIKSNSNKHSMFPEIWWPPPLVISWFYFIPFHYGEYIYVGSFLTACSNSSKARALFEQYFKVLIVTTSLTESFNLLKHTTLYENKQNERKIAMETTAATILAEFRQIMM